MEELDNVFVSSLHEKLKKKINAGIFCYIDRDNLFVRIKNDNNLWECSFGNIWEIIVRGTPMDMMVNKVVAEYKAEVLRRFFY